MTFADKELSVDDGEPLELLMVSFLTTNYYFTTSESDHIHDGHTYLPMPFSHSRIAPAADVAKAQMTLRVPQDCPVGELFRVQSPPGVVTMTLFAKHAGEADVKAIWKGRIVNAQWEEPWLSLTCESVFSSLQRLGIRRKYATQCPHPLYSLGHGLCNVVRNDFKVDYVVTEISGNTVTCALAAGQAINYFAGGYVTWVHATSGYDEMRMVKSSLSGAFELTAPPAGLVVGATISTYPGCDHLPTTCNSKFNNSLNYGGMPFLPTKNPFGGSTIY